MCPSYSELPSYYEYHECDNYAVFRELCCSSFVRKTAEDLAEQYGGDQVRPAAVTRSLVEFASSSFQSTGY